MDALVTAEFDGQLPKLTAANLSEKLEEFYTKAEAGELSHDRAFQSMIAMNQFSEIIPMYFENAIESEDSPKKRKDFPKKMLILSLHESTLLSYLIALNVSEAKYTTVSYASNMILELRRNNATSSHYTVNATLNSQELFMMDLQEFNEKVKKIGTIHGNWKDVCRTNKTTMMLTEQSGNNIMLLIIALAAALFITISISVIVLLRKRVTVDTRNSYAEVVTNN